MESKDKVPSLLDSAGYLWPDSPTAASHIKPEEAEREIRTQIEHAIAVGIHPTHLDTHMGTLFNSPELFAVFSKVARDYHLPFLALRLPGELSKLLSQLSDKDVVVDSFVMATNKNKMLFPAQFARDLLTKSTAAGSHEDHVRFFILLPALAIG